MAEITINFKYDVPDRQWSSTNLDKREGSWIYKGPENLYVPVGPTGKMGAQGAIDADLNPSYQFSPAFKTVLVNVNDWPIIGALYYPNVPDLNNPPQTQTTLPDGRTVYIHDPLLLTQIYKLEDIEYNFPTNHWTIPFMTNPETWDGIRTKRDGLLAASDMRVRDDAPIAVQDAWKTYRQELRDITTTWADYSPEEVIFPPQPIIVPAAII
jgi:hypothetical protein